MCIKVMQVACMKTRAEAAGPGITVRLTQPIRKRLMRLARDEHRSAAAYIKELVERDLRQREEAERVVRVYVAPDTPPATGEVLREEGETPEQHTYRAEVLNALFGLR